MIYFEIFEQLFIQLIAWLPGVIALWVFADLFVSMIFKDRG